MSQARSVECPRCGGSGSRVKDSRPTGEVEGYVAIRRRRVCAKCDHWFTTYEACAEAFSSSVAVDQLRGSRGADLERALVDALEAVRRLRGGAVKSTIGRNGVLRELRAEMTSKRQ